MKIPLQLLCFLIIASTCSYAQRFQARFVTSAYAWERYDAVGTSTQHLFGYQTVQLSLAKKDLFLGTYLQGFNDFTGPVQNDAYVRLYNFYGKWSNIGGFGDLSAGRQAIFAGIGNGTIDGAAASVKMFDNRVKLMGYYGSLPPPRQKISLTDDASNNMMMGTQLVASAGEVAQVSVSYMKRKIATESYKAIRRDSLFNPYTIEIKPSAGVEELVGGDLNLTAGNFISGYARYDYDALAEKMARLQFFGRVRPFEYSNVKALSSLSLTGEYIQREPRLSYNSIFSVFAFNTLKEYEVGAEYAFTPTWQAFAKYGSVNYGDEDDQRLTLGLNADHVSFSFSHSVGYAGELSAASFNVGYPILDNQVVPTLFFSYAKYKLSEDAKDLDGAISAGMGVVYRPVPTFSIETQGQWIQNKIYSNDKRLFIRISYFFSQQLAIF
ncbi:MAG: hypothetical protein V1799_00355 [bacterium]